MAGRGSDNQKGHDCRGINAYHGPRRNDQSAQTTAGSVAGDGPIERDPEEANEPGHGQPPRQPGQQTDEEPEAENHLGKAGPGRPGNKPFRAGAVG
jgi:hypothetical protein